MNISDLRHRHTGQPAFCLGTAPHLNDLDLSLLRDKVTIGCNQLVQRADELALDYVCFQRDQRFRPLRDELGKTNSTCFVLPEDVLKSQGNWDLPEAVAKRTVTVKGRFSSPGHADFFSLNLEQFVALPNVMAMQVQLAVWMGCSSIYLLGVDSQLRQEGGQRPTYYADPPGKEADKSKNLNRDIFPETAEWLKKAHDLLRGRQISLYNGAGELSSLDALPRLRYRAAVGNPVVAVTSKTFCNDDYLVHELNGYFSEVRLNESPSKLQGDELAAFLGDADAMILGTEPFSAEVMAQLPFLRYVSKYGVGLNNIDFSAAQQLEIEVTYSKGVNSDSVGELVLGLAIMLMRRIDESVQGYRSQQWKKLPGKELAEMTVGIVGYGHVGKVVAQKFAALGVKRLLVSDVVDIQPATPAESVPADYLYQHCDVVSLHVSMEPQNYHMINAGLLATFKPGAFLINTSRGEIIDESALASAIRNGHIGGAALDVFEDEPTPNPDLISCPNMLTTCHIAGSSNRAIKNMGWAAIEGLLKLLNKKPI